MSIAIAASVLVHGALLAVRFAAPDSFRFKPADPGLEVILVNAKHDRAPLKAEALAQANLDGGGNAEAGRSTSPLPDMRRSEDGDGMKTMQRRIEELERQQRMLTQASKKSKVAAAPSKDQPNPQVSQPRPDAADASESAKEILRREAEIAKRIEDENKRPKKTFISPSTREVGYAMYFNSVREKIEKVGTVNFPQKDGKKMYGELTLSISIFQDGSIYVKDKDDGIAVERSSGNSALDDAARRIVRRAAPFGAFAKNMRSSGKDDVWVMTTRFKFTRENELEAVMQGSSH
ncbi:TonB C-terminal domain-containing protein [Noviherbaspirillum sp. CPCC 100848]|uniref:TonB C-terminal domain-containing protein n=1 Tax=Noviherbaspirillum album TaxID=3080276 RepID=A0ABU6J6L0_9BURK|nr:TonB C-terminal domain-containing protein [Noviherbaspirillum sp. CPCC 100848]MEC4719246.1 TonB C-terminal domain-containing protein [Noviherbaspirillum sp. CPCC 100848]